MRRCSPTPRRRASSRARGCLIRKPETWAEMAFLVGHWQLLGHGMFVVEERATGAFRRPGRAAAAARLAGRRDGLGAGAGRARQGLCRRGGPRHDRLVVRALPARSDRLAHRPAQRRQPARRGAPGRAPHRRAVRALPGPLRHLGTPPRATGRRLSRNARPPRPDRPFRYSPGRGGDIRRRRGPSAR